MLKVGVIGATGYTGLELVRLLKDHPEVEISALTSEQKAGEKYSEVFPTFRGEVDLELEKLDPSTLNGKIEFAFLCLPHQKAMETAQAFRQAQLPLVDLSADFRISAAEIYEAWYGPHRCQELLQEAVYGLPELHRDKIVGAKFVANPGCYPTSVILGLAPLIKENAVDRKTIHCDAKSGVSGAGKTLTPESLYCEINEGLKAYKVGVHRHTPEIEQELSRLAGEEILVSFTPHLIPMDRGILATLYAQASKKMDGKSLWQLFQDFYQKEPFVRLHPLGSFPSTQAVRMKNYCDIGVHYDARTGRVVVITAIDNLTKGASGQAIQNMNLMMGFEETSGLR
ncbi:MAG: N-acetyl-gamma-glutamyl-phosphate reductase [bacterium]|nr:N-acetyl-gamma-glutamyl-phosphate reductase [bacterium]